MEQGVLGYMTIRPGKSCPDIKIRLGTLEAVIPSITTLDHIENPSGRNERFINPLVTYPTLFHSRVRTLLPSLEYLHTVIVNISALTDHTEQHTADAILA